MEGTKRDIRGAETAIRLRLGDEAVEADMSMM
jgi:hypothetical protein